MTDLIQRLQALTEPSRDVDLDVWEAVNGLMAGCLDIFDHMGGDVPTYTSSIDAVIDLIEREMPGKFWAVSATPADDGECIGEVGDRHEDAAAMHPLPAVALLIAFLSARGGE